MPAKKKVNTTGLPDQLKEGIENLSGISMDDVKVHYDSSKPALLQASAYARGSDITVAPGQEKHLPHEAWHVVQQKQGKVKPTMQMKGDVVFNDAAGLEAEADIMGSKAIQSINDEEASFAVYAKRITTPLNFDDLVVDNPVMEGISEIINWVKQGSTVQPGYRALFYGPPGTGKTLTATLIGKATGCDVYRVDLSALTSKYIGETEKNLTEIFAVAKQKNWILFFDEVEALVGEKTKGVISSQTATFFEMIAEHPGVVIVANCIKILADRFQNTIYFNMPDTGQRLTLWQSAFSGKITLTPDVDLPKIAEQYELTGGAIINVLRYCAVAAVKRNDTVVTQPELLKGIDREMKK